MQRYVLAIAILGLCLFTLMPGVCQGQVILLNNEQIQVANSNGVDLSEPGQYTVWVWSLDTLPLSVFVDGSPLTIEPDAKAKPDAYSWKKAGTFSLDQGKIISLQLITDNKTKTLDPTCTGWLALSSDPDWNPTVWFELCKVFPASVHESDDKRLGVVRRIEQYYPFHHFKDRWEWMARKQTIKDHFLMSMGCYPMPPKTSLNPQITGKQDYEDYTIENVYFESLPGFFATGNLYRPKGKQGPFPAVLCPHGHWTEGILTNSDENSVPGRCINFAKQGYVVFAIDMIGYNNSKQLTHKFGGPAEWLWGLSLHGLQFWNSVRAIDYLTSLPDVDQNRIAVTGASGGGTQTYGIMAMDERVKAAAPVNMLSLHYQGGCLCENAPNLRIAMNNLELGALMAPRPLLMVSCTGDWTAETLRVEYPAMRSIYELYEKPEQVATIQLQANHNYNQQSREAVYAWFGRWMLGDNNADDFKERPFTFDVEKMHVFGDKLPDNAIDENQLIALWKDLSEKQLQSLFPDNQSALSALKRRAETALRNALGVENPDSNDLNIERIDAKKIDDVYVEKIVLGRKGIGDRIPALILCPKNSTDKGTLLVHCGGKDAWFDGKTGKPDALLQSLLDQGQTALLADVFMTGEYNSPFEKAQRNTGTDSSHFLTYNQTETALRVQDILTAVSYMQSRYDAKNVNLVGGGDAGLWCLLAAPLAKDLKSIAIDAGSFNNKEDSAYLERFFVPGLRRAGDFRAAQAILAPTPLMIHNTGGVFDTGWASAAYQTAGKPDLLEILDAPVAAENLCAWIKDMAL